VIAETATGINVSGTDNVAYPDDDAVSSTGEFTAPDNTANYYVWVEVQYSGSAWSANIRHAANPAASGASNPNPWATWPDLDGHRFLVGIIDTAAGSNSSQAYVRQLIRQDIFMGPIFNVCVSGAEEPYAIPGLAKHAL
jgi:hypothetical protein